MVSALFAAAIGAYDLFRIVEPDIAGTDLGGPGFGGFGEDIGVREAATARLIAAGVDAGATSGGLVRIRGGRHGERSPASGRGVAPSIS